MRRDIKHVYAKTRKQRSECPPTAVDLFGFASNKHLRPIQRDCLRSRGLGGGETAAVSPPNRNRSKKSSETRSFLRQATEGRTQWIKSNEMNGPEHFLEKTAVDCVATVAKTKLQVKHNNKQIIPLSYSCGCLWSKHLVRHIQICFYMFWGSKVEFTVKKKNSNKKMHIKKTNRKIPIATK